MADSKVERLPEKPSAILPPIETTMSASLRRPARLPETHLLLTAIPACQPAIILTTCPSQAEAERIGRLLLQQRLAACVQYEAITSQYLWNGEICHDDEIRITIKTSRHCYREIQKNILANHSYECPQILMQNVSRGYAPYLRWLKQSLG